MTFKRKLIIYSILISTIPVMLVGWLATSFASKGIQEEVQLNHHLLLKQVEYRLVQFMNNLNTQAVMLTTTPMIEKAIETGPSENTDVSDSMALVEMLRKQANYSLIRYDIALVYQRYNYVFSTIHKSVPYQDSIYEKIMKSSPANRNAPIVISPQTHNNPGLILIRPIPYYSHYTDGFIALNVDVHELSKLLMQSDTEPNYRSDILIIDDSGKIVVSNGGGDSGAKLLSSSELYRFWQKPQVQTGFYSQNGEKFQLSALKLPSYKWTILASTPMSELNGKSNNIKAVTWGVITVLMLFWLMVSITSTNRLHAPIERLLMQVPSAYKQHKMSSNEFQIVEELLQDTIKDNQELKHQFNTHLPSLKENMSHHLVWGDMSEAQIQLKSEQLGLSIEGTHYRVLLVIVDQLSDFTNNYMGQDQSLIHYAVKKMVEEICEEDYSCIAFVPQPGQVALIVGERDSIKDSEWERRLLHTAEKIRHAIDTYFRFTVSVCISSSETGLMGIRACYQEAAELSAYRLMLGPNITMTKNSLEPSMKQYSIEILALQKKVLSSLISGKLQEAIAQLHELTVQIASRVHHPDTARGIYSHLLVELDVYLHELGHELQPLFTHNLHSKLHEWDTVEEIREWLIQEVFAVVSDFLNQLTFSKQDMAVLAVMQSVDENWDADLMQIAEQHHISVPSLSRSFKEKTGENFSDYLIRTRMTKAQEWLRNTRMPIANIAERLHYSNVQNFNRSFKQYTGITPGKYRSEQEEN